MQLVFTIVLSAVCAVSATDRPIIGVLTQEVNSETYPNHTSFIPASYVKAVEQSGAQVVPVFINGTIEYYREILSSVNGVLFPGGGVAFTNKGGFADAGRAIVKLAKEINDKGDHFPVFGVCLGFELLFYLETESYNVLGNCSAVDLSLPLTFETQFRKSQLYRGASRRVLEILRNHPVTFNHHTRCITEHLLKRYKLLKAWHVLSSSNDTNGLEFVSSAEHHDYPIAGVQFHPEKIAFEWRVSEKIPHTKNALVAARYFYDWLIQEAKKNNHSFANTDAEDSALIYNYNANYVHNYYEQVYLFN